MDPAHANTDRLLRQAIAERRLVAFRLHGLPRQAEPHDYGVMGAGHRLFFYQVGGQSRSPRPLGWRWADLEKIEGLEILDRRFAGPRAVPSGRHITWDRLIATVSGRATEE
jgi:hypothetical protein